MARAEYQVILADGMKTVGSVYGFVLKSGIEKALLDLVFLRASQINGCAYCVNMHARDAMHDGASVERLMLLSVWRESGALFTERERAALTWTERITTIATAHPSDEEYALLSAYFSEHDAAALTLAIGLINTYNRMAIAFQQPLETPRRVA